MFDSLRKSPQFQILIDTTARLGKDPLHVQGPGGNTSLKSGDAMWVKASGTWLAEAGARDIFVPCDAGVLRRALDTGSTEQPDAAEFVPAGVNTTGLISSIETPVHAALDWPVVLHTHCVATIAVAILADGADRIADAMHDYTVAFVPYVKPGWDLASEIRAAVKSETRVVILGNHGLVVCGETVEEAEALLRSVSARLEPAQTHPAMEAADGLSGRLAGSGWMPAPHAVTHAIARDFGRLEIALGATLYPDHLIFLGPGCVAEEDEIPRNILLFPGLGAAVPRDATPAVLALAGCLGNVLARVEAGADVVRLSALQEAELLDWDAEKHRQSLNRATAE